MGISACSPSGKIAVFRFIYPKLVAVTSKNRKYHDCFSNLLLFTVNFRNHETIYKTGFIKNSYCAIYGGFCFYCDRTGGSVKVPIKLK